MSRPYVSQLGHSFQTSRRRNTDFSTFFFYQNGSAHLVKMAKSGCALSIFAFGNVVVLNGISDDERRINRNLKHF